MTLTMDNRLRIAIFLYGYPIANSPSIINCVSLLANAGYTIDVFTDRAQLGGYDFQHPQIHLYMQNVERSSASRHTPEVGIPSTQPTGLRSRIRDRLPSPLLEATAPLRRWLWERWYSYHAEWNGLKTQIVPLLSYVRWVSERSVPNSYLCLIGVEDEGLIATWWVATRWRIRFIYYNLEIRIPQRGATWVQRLRKGLERSAHRRAWFTIIQDAERAATLQKVNRLVEMPSVFVPVAATGPAFTDKTSLLRARLHIPAHKHIILYAGLLAEWAMCLELAEAARQWPEDWVLVLHGFVPNNYEHYIAQLREAVAVSCGHALLSLEPVPYEQLDELLASADVGLALYRNLDENFYQISSASGKLAHYTKCGLPIVIVDFESTRRLMDRYGCGICIKDVSQVTPAVKTILENYDSFRSNAFDCYRDHYNYDVHFAAVIERIDSLRGGA